MLAAAAAGGISPEVIKVNKRTIPSSGENLPVIGLGTWQTFDTNGSVANLQEIVRLFVEYGGTVIDSSPMYGNAEKVTGLIHANLDKPPLFLATKVWTTGKENGIRQIENSFRYFRTNIIDLLQIHNLTDWQIHINTLRQLREEGRIRYTGITHYVPSAFGAMEKIMKTEKIDFIQIPYSVVLRDAEKSILPLARDKGIAVLINRPFEGGDIFRSFKTRPVPDELKKFGNWSQIFLKFILSHPDVTCIIPATSKKDHLELNMKAGSGILPDNNEREKIAKIVRE